MTGMTGHNEQSDWEQRLRERKILELKPESEVCIKRDVHTLDVELPADVELLEDGDPAKQFAQAFGDMMAEDGAEFGLITLRRPKNQTGKPFEVGHRFQGRYSLSEAAKKMFRDFCDGLFKGVIAHILKFFLIRKLLRLIEDEHLSDYGEIIAIDFPGRFQYQLSLPKTPSVRPTWFGAHTRFILVVDIIWQCPLLR